MVHWFPNLLAVKRYQASVLEVAVYLHWNSDYEYVEKFKDIQKNVRKPPYLATLVLK